MAILLGLTTPQENLTPHPYHVTADNVAELEGCTFVFLAAGEAEDKAAILAWLRANAIPTVEVGMGVCHEGDHLSGLVTVVNHFPELAEPQAVSASGLVNDYDRNIQVSDLNCLNAVLAIISWKKYLGYYASHSLVEETVYKIFTGTVRNGFDHKETTNDSLEGPP